LPPPSLLVSEWADERRVLQSGTSRQPGPWNTNVTPYLRGIMDAYNDSAVRHIVFCKGTQAGGTESLYNILGYILDMEPYPTLLVYPREDDAKQVSRTRLKPMIAACPSLHEKAPKTKELFQALEMHFPGMPLYLVGANSAAQLSQKPCRNILRDEIDKYPARVGKDASPLALSEERAKSFWDIRKIVDVSSPTYEDVGVWKSMQECDEIYTYHVPCPYCGVMQPLVFNEQRVKFELKGKGGARISHAKNTTKYLCESCEKQIKDSDKLSILTSGAWVGTKQPDFPPESVGFHLNSLYSPFLTFGDVTEKFLKEKYEKSLQNFINGWLAEPWKDYQTTRVEDDMLRLRDDRPAGLVPSSPQISCLTAGVDTQDTGFWYEIRAWGWGMAQDSWQIRAGFVTTFSGLAQVLFEDEYRDVAGDAYHVHFVVQDAMGHRTSEVYDFARLFRGRLVPFQGSQRMKQPYAFSKLDMYPGSNKPIPGGIQLLRGDVTFFKNKLSSLLEIPVNDPGSWRMNRDLTQEWALQMCSEYLDEKGLWQQIGRRANHGWDCSVYNLIAAEVLGVKHWVQKDSPASVAPNLPNMPPSPQQPNAPRRKVRSRGLR